MTAPAAPLVFSKPVNDRELLDVIERTVTKAPGAA